MKDKELDEIAKKFDWKSFWECQKKSQIREKMYHILSKSELHKRGINMRQLVQEYQLWDFNKQGLY